jgi:hypothetical protein
VKDELVKYGARYDGVWSWALAKSQESTSRAGKWMFWPKSEEAIEIWRIICELTRSHHLGIQAKMRVEKRDAADERLICVYTRDSDDMEDLQRGVDTGTCALNPAHWGNVSWESRSPSRISV